MVGREGWADTQEKWWYWPPLYSHYFVGCLSLCGKWGIEIDVVLNGMPGGDTCTMCKSMLELR